MHRTVAYEKLKECFLSPNAQAEPRVFRVGLKSRVRQPYQQLDLPSSLDHLVRPREHFGRNRQTDLLGRFEIDDELDLRRLLD